MLWHTFTVSHGGAIHQTTTHILFVWLFLYISRYFSVSFLFMIVVFNKCLIIHAITVAIATPKMECALVWQCADVEKSVN